MTQQRGSSPGISSSVWVGTPIMGLAVILLPVWGRSPAPGSTRGGGGGFPRIYHGFGGLRDHRVHHVLEVARLTESSELTVGTGALIENLEGVLHFLPAPQLIEDIVEEPLDQ